MSCDFEWISLVPVSRREIIRAHTFLLVIFEVNKNEIFDRSDDLCNCLRIRGL